MCQHSALDGVVVTGKFSVATSDKSDKTAKQGSSRSRATRATPRKKATRPPTIDLEATEVAEASGAGSTPPKGPENKSSSETPADESAAGKTSEGSGEKSAGAPSTKATKEKPASKPASADGYTRRTGRRTGKGRLSSRAC